MPSDAARQVAGWSDPEWTRFRRLVAMHGLGATLARSLVREGGGSGPLPDAEQAWLAEQELLTAQRTDRMHAELAAILAAANRAGVPVLPLKGARLADVTAVDPRRRPMADLDLLVRPADRARFAALLASLGYTAEPGRARRSMPATFVDAGGGRVVSYDGEHPDNPRRVEVHTEVQRHLWEWLDEDRLTVPMWAAATPGRVAGEPALVAPLPMVLEHLAVHATANLLRGRGRLIQWLDLARLAAAGHLPDRWIVPRLAYPSLALAARVLPPLRSGSGMEELQRLAPAAVRAWVARVPLDGRAGLEIGRPLDRVPSLRDRGERWRPTRVRLAVAYGDASLPVALARHAAMLARTAVDLSGRRATPGETAS